ncbi:MAG: sigma-54-dependent Fis family transcriptional regulator [Desulfamplus sp.]|nr:sigma-54-dependent Fis family transcriptional regulator [Desulfamplus sp.]
MSHTKLQNIISNFKKLTILLVEDENALRYEIASFLELYYDTVIQASNGDEALRCFNIKGNSSNNRAIPPNSQNCSSHFPDLVISDIRMPLMDGLELASQIRKLSPNTPIIFCTAYTETEYLIKAIELGVAAFVRKPIDTDELLNAISKATLPLLQRREIDGLSDELTASIANQIGNAPAYKYITEQATRVARTSFNILLQGETGTGKSRLASIIHNLSPRRDASFITVQTGTLPFNLAESELFGHLKGAFTGADRNKIGLVEAADKGTIFLDDIESCPKELQAKLLRFVEEKKFTPIGSKSEREVDIRIISATNQNLKDEVLAGRFREDLYYRLADVVISLPPLRETPDAIRTLALQFLQETSNELGCQSPFLDKSACDLLSSMEWNGNIRQLKSVIRRAVLNGGKVISAADISIHIEPTSFKVNSADSSFSTPITTTFTIPPTPPPFPCSMDRLEKWTLEQALNYCEGKRMKTAAMLGMNYYTFRRRLEKHEIEVGEEVINE